MISSAELASLEAKLCDFNASNRKLALKEFHAQFSSGKLEAKPATQEHNMHCHSFFSYNGYGFSPSRIACWARREGLFAAGLVDFDVLDGVDEFIAAAKILDLRFSCGIETRVFIPELAAHEINSPGEPGIAYHTGVGFSSSAIPEQERKFLGGLKNNAAARTRFIVDRVNPFLAPASIDFEREVLSLTPSGNATERHVCAAYEKKAAALFPELSKRAAFWAEKLGLTALDAEKTVKDSVKLQGLIRAKTMKSGGPGYVKADPKSFPALLDFNAFVRKSGAIPTIAWLNGESSGEADIKRLFEIHEAAGAAAINIIPDRNWDFPDPAVRDKKVRELHRIINAAKERSLPIIVGTEMNAPGQKFIDGFSAEPLMPFLNDFIDGAAIMFAHTLLEPMGLGYLSDWAAAEFSSRPAKNKFFAAFGRNTTPVGFSQKRLEITKESLHRQAIAMA
ncbi:MAG: hypothetical protein A2X49_14385 [Lentisphaerae bacterium GWF2_52_8]|nr:MAG: hypothetical protein A2X49_14385 [Lentisphaerae bacterium GWF2_52_8]